MYSAIRTDDTALFEVLDKSIGRFREFYGINSINFSYSAGKTPLNILGHNTASQINNSEFRHEIQLNKSLTNQDIFWNNKTGEKFDLFLSPNKNTSNATLTGIYLESGVITDYSVQASVNEVPQVSVSCIFEKDSHLDDETDIFETVEDNQLVFIPQTGLQLNLGGAIGTNALQSFQFSAQFNWNKNSRVKNNSQTNSFFLELNRPIIYSASFEILLDDYRISNISFDSPKTCEFKIYSESGLLNTFTVENAQLIGESVGVDSNNEATVKIDYQGFGSP